MKKTKVLLMMLAFCFVASQALAFPIKPESEGGGKIIYSSNNSGSQVQVQGTDTLYDAFCLQPKVDIWNSYDQNGELNYLYTVDAVGGITLADETKWLYAAYKDQETNLFEDVNYNSISGIDSLASLVQYAMWYNQGFAEPSGNHGLTRDQMKMVQAWELLDDYWNASGWDSYSNVWDVTSLELSLKDSDCYGGSNCCHGGSNPDCYTGSVQAQIVGAKLVSPPVNPPNPPGSVPEPTTMALFGLGLLGFAGVARRYNNLKG